MADTIRRVVYFYSQVPDQAGEAFKILGRLKEAGVNLISFTAFPIEGGKSQLDFVPENADAFTKAIKDINVTVSAKKQAFFIRGSDRAGAVAEILKRLADAKVNVHAANAACGSGGGFGMILWVKPQSYETAAKALGV
jgi:hypothetical protein